MVFKCFYTRHCEPQNNLDALLLAVLKTTKTQNLKNQQHATPISLLNMTFTQLSMHLLVIYKTHMQSMKLEGLGFAHEHWLMTEPKLTP